MGLSSEIRFHGVTFFAEGVSHGIGQIRWHWSVVLTSSGFPYFNRCIVPEIAVAKKNLTLDTTVVFLITVREFCKPVDILAAILG